MNNLPIPFDQLPSSGMKLYELEKNHILFRQGEQVSSLFYVTTGEVTLSRYGLAGDEVIIHVAQSKETFAEAALFSNVYHCNAVVTKDTQLWAINKSVTLEFAKRNPPFAMDLTERFAKQIQQLRSQKELLAVRSATERVYMALNQGLLNTSIKQFANSIGLTHEVTYRALAQLVRDKRVIKRGRGHYHLLGAE
jgi:CRP-like cAMP-binding protein